MKNSFITKRMIAYVVKDLMEETPFSKITIQQIMAVAKFRRQTFYDYFEDKYQLLEWLFQQDVKENVGDYIGYEHWSEVFDRFFIYIDKNSVFLNNALLSSYETGFDIMFQSQCLLLTTQLFNEIIDENNYIEIDSFKIEFYAHALSSLCMSWIFNNEKYDVVEVSDKMRAQLLQMFK